eukprot:gene6350-4576_t
MNQRRGEKQDGSRPREPPDSVCLPFTFPSFFFILFVVLRLRYGTNLLIMNICILPTIFFCLFTSVSYFFGVFNFIIIIIIIIYFYFFVSVSSNTTAMIFIFVLPVPAWVRLYVESSAPTND